MKKSTHIAAGLLAFILLVLPACDWFKKESSSSEEPALRLLDINTAALYNDAHIPGALHVALNELEEKVENWSKQTPIITYCSDYNCMASHRAAKLLTELGFSDVSVYAGGIHEWYTLSKERKDEYPIEGPVELAFFGKPVEILDPERKEGNVVTAEEVSRRIQRLQKS